MKVSTILDHIDLGEIALPEFQRGYVWSRAQVRAFMESLYRGHPVGSLLVWTTHTEKANARGDTTLSPGYVKLLLDGQQRITSLYGIIRGKAPQFFDGNGSAFLDLYFNIEEEAFEFYGPVKMQDNPLWINTTELITWNKAGFYFKLDWFPRCINTTLTGEALFSALSDVSIDGFQSSLEKTEKNIDKLLNLIASRLGLDHDRVLGSKYSFPTMVRLLHEHDHLLSDPVQRDRLLYWYIHTFLWGRYAGSTESVINQDLEVIRQSDDPVGGLIERLRQNRGDLKLQPDDFIGWSKSSRFYPLLYLLTRAWHSLDFETGVELSGHTLGKFTQLQVHHIFPKALLYEQRYVKSEVNALVAVGTPVAGRPPHRSGHEDFRSSGSYLG